MVFILEKLVRNTKLKIATFALAFNMFGCDVPLNIPRENRIEDFSEVSDDSGYALVSSSEGDVLIRYVDENNTPLNDVRVEGSYYESEDVFEIFSSPSHPHIQQYDIINVDFGRVEGLASSLPFSFSVNIKLKSWLDQINQEIHFERKFFSS